MLASLTIIGGLLTIYAGYLVVMAIVLSLLGVDLHQLRDDLREANTSALLVLLMGARWVRDRFHRKDRP